MSDRPTDIAPPPRSAAAIPSRRPGSRSSPAPDRRASKDDAARHVVVVPDGSSRQEGMVISRQEKYGFIRSAEHDARHFFHVNDSDGNAQRGSRVSFVVGIDSATGRTVATDVCTLPPSATQNARRGGNAEGSQQPSSRAEADSDWRARPAAPAPEVATADRDAAPAPAPVTSPTPTPEPRRAAAAPSFGGSDFRNGDFGPASAGRAPQPGALSHQGQGPPRQGAQGQGPQGGRGEVAPSGGPPEGPSYGGTGYPQGPYGGPGGQYQARPGPGHYNPTSDYQQLGGARGSPGPAGRPGPTVRARVLVAAPGPSSSRVDDGVLELFEGEVVPGRKAQPAAAAASTLPERGLGESRGRGEGDAQVDGSPEEATEAEEGDVERAGGNGVDGGEREGGAAISDPLRCVGYGNWAVVGAAEVPLIPGTVVSVVLESKSTRARRPDLSVELDGGAGPALRAVSVRVLPGQPPEVSLALDKRDAAEQERRAKAELERSRTSETEKPKEAAVEAEGASAEGASAEGASAEGASAEGASAEGASAEGVPAESVSADGTAPVAADSAAGGEDAADRDAAAPAGAHALAPGRLVGRVAVLKKEFGFIRRADRPGDIFFHFSQLLPELPRQDLRPGLDVAFSLLRHDRGRNAAARVGLAPEGAAVFERISDEPLQGTVLERSGGAFGSGSGMLGQDRYGGGGFPGTLNPIAGAYEDPLAYGTEDEASGRTGGVPTGGAAPPPQAGAAGVVEYAVAPGVWRRLLFWPRDLAPGAPQPRPGDRVTFRLCVDLAAERAAAAPDASRFARAAAARATSVTPLRTTGQIVNFNAQRGFGFLDSEAAGRLYFRVDDVAPEAALDEVDDGPAAAPGPLRPPQLRPGDVLEHSVHVNPRSGALIAVRLARVRGAAARARAGRPPPREPAGVAALDRKLVLGEDPLAAVAAPAEREGASAKGAKATAATAATRGARTVSAPARTPPETDEERTAREARDRVREDRAAERAAAQEARRARAALEPAVRQPTLPEPNARGFALTRTVRARPAVGSFYRLPGDPEPALDSEAAGDAEAAAEAERRAAAARERKAASKEKRAAKLAARAAAAAATAAAGPSPLLPGADPAAAGEPTGADSPAPRSDGSPAPAEPAVPAALAAAPSRPPTAVPRAPGASPGPHSRPPSVAAARASPSAEPPAPPAPLSRTASIGTPRAQRSPSMSSVLSAEAPAFIPPAGADE